MNGFNQDVGWKKLLNIVAVLVPMISLLVWTVLVGVGEINKKADRTELVYMEQKLIQRDHDLKTEFMEQINSTNSELVRIGGRQTEQIALLNELIGMHKSKMRERE